MAGSAFRDRRWVSVTLSPFEKALVESVIPLQFSLCEKHMILHAWFLPNTSANLANTISTESD